MKMKVIPSAAAAALALATSGVSGFSVAPRAARPATRMMSSTTEETTKEDLEKQLAAGIAMEMEAGSRAAVNGAPPPVYYPPPVQYIQPPPVVPTPPPQYTPPPPAQQPQEEGIGGLGVGALAVLGVPLWIGVLSPILSTPVSAPPAPPAPVQQMASTVAAPPQVAPLSAVSSVGRSDGAPGGVVVMGQPITKAEVRGLFNLWNDALKTGNPAVVANRYAKEGVLLPTLSDRPRNDYEAIKDYFVGFCSKGPDGKILEGEIYVGNNWAQDAGIYEFTFADGSKVKARYSFVYVYENGQWMISHHHSSLMPEEVVRPAKISKEEVRQLFGLWNDALKTGEPYKVADRYTKDAVLLPTLSDRARYDRDGIADYFVGFLAKKPTGKILEGNIKIGPNWAQDAGIYEFTFADGSAVQGRYSYVYSYENGEWKISNHHSSIMPEGAVAAMKRVAAMEKVET